MATSILVLVTTGVLFATGATGVMLRRNPVAMLMSIEIMLNAGNLLLVLGSRANGNDAGQATALIMLVIAAAEAVVGLGLALVLFRNRDPVDVDEPRTIHG